MKYYEFFLNNEIINQILEYDMNFHIFKISIETYPFDYLQLINFSFEILRDFEKFILLLNQKSINVMELDEQIMLINEKIFHYFPQLEKYNILEIVEGFSLIILSKNPNLESEIDPSKVLKIEVIKEIFSPLHFNMIKSRLFQILKAFKLMGINYALEKKGENHFFHAKIYFESVIKEVYLKDLIESIKELFDIVDYKEILVSQFIKENKENKNTYFVLTNI